jgi:hypothetical protein
MFSFTRTLLESQGSPCRVVPCTVTQLSPLLISLLGQVDVPAVKIAGADYSLGAANCLVASPSKPIVLPIA